TFRSAGAYTQERRRMARVYMSSGGTMRGTRLMLVLTGVLVALTGSGPLTARGGPADGGVVQADVDPKIAALLNTSSEERMRQLMEKLVSFGTRNTLSAVDSPTQGIGAARQWILDEMKRSSPKLQVSFDTHQIPQSVRITRPIELRNVVAILPGKSPRRI